jgi:phospholipase C
VIGVLDRGGWALSRVVRVAAVLTCLLLAGTADPGRGAMVAGVPPSPIRHVVIIYQENHSFDNVLGRFCGRVDAGFVRRAGVDDRCDGATRGMLSDGGMITLSSAQDVVPFVGHGVAGQQTAIDGGRMDGFDRIPGCTVASGYVCYSQYAASQIPNVTILARRFALSDHTFSSYPEPSWAAHLELVAATRDWFQGNNPKPAAGVSPGPGWGCDSDLVAPWQATPTAPIRHVPSCVPKHDGTGPFRPSPVAWVPTIMDRLNAANLTWKLYTSGPRPGRTPYGWAICPTFADCLYTKRHNNQVPDTSFITNATSGTLPNFSILLPSVADSQHNGFSMTQGDNWIGQAVEAIEHGPDWASTAIFITWDDCGCFYDHVPPPPGLGPRVPMLIVSPYARAGYTDTNQASLNSLLAFTEHTFGLPPLSHADNTAYPYTNAFNYAQTPLPPAPLGHTAIPQTEQRYIQTHQAGKTGDT